MSDGPERSGAGERGPGAGPGTAVTLHFALRLADGALVDATPTDGAATFCWGDGRIPGAFEGLLRGLRAGDRARFEVPAAQAFGLRQPHNVHRRPRSEFPEHLGLEAGLVLQFQDPRGDGVPGVVRSVTDDDVEVDFNHPLAGHDLIFEVDIVEVREASSNNARANAEDDDAS